MTGLTHVSEIMLGSNVENRGHTDSVALAPSLELSLALEAPAE